MSYNSTTDSPRIYTLNYIDMVIALVRRENTYRLVGLLGDPLLSNNDISWRDSTGSTPLQVNGRMDDTHLAQFLREHSIYVEPRPPPNGKPNFYIVSIEGCRSLVQRMGGGDEGFTSVRGADGSTSLHIACEINRVEIVKYLLVNGAQPNVQRKDGCYPVQIAARNGNVAIVNLLVEHGSCFNVGLWASYAIFRAAEDSKRLSVTDIRASDGSTNLHIACEAGDVSLVERMITMGASLNKQRKDGFYPLHIAADHGNCKLIRLLIKSGASVNATSRSGYEPMLAAIDRGHFEAAGILLASGAQPTIFPPNEPPPHARVLYFPEHPLIPGLLERLLMAGSNIRWRDGNGFTILHLAASHGSIDYMRLLLRIDILNPGAISNKGYTPLWCAAHNGHVGVVKLLLEEGVDTSAHPQRECGTALSIALHKGWNEVVETLL